MQNSAKHLTAALIGFIAIIACTHITLIFSEEAASVLLSAYTLGLSAVLTAVCIIIAVREKKTRRYFLSLSMYMFCCFFADLYLGLYSLLSDTTSSVIITYPISVIANLGASAFIAAFCARIWYEEIPKHTKSGGKLLIVSVLVVLIFSIIGGIGIRQGFPIISGVFYIISAVTAIWYAVRFFTVPAAAKSFLPLMTVLTLFIIYEMLWACIFPLILESSSGIVRHLVSDPAALLQMLIIPSLLYAEEQGEKRMSEKTVLKNQEAA